MQMLEGIQQTIKQLLCSCNVGMSSHLTSVENSEGGVGEIQFSIATLCPLCF